MDVEIEKINFSFYNAPEWFIKINALDASYQEKISLVHKKLLENDDTIPQVSAELFYYYYKETILKNI